MMSEGLAETQETRVAALPAGPRPSANGRPAAPRTWRTALTVADGIMLLIVGIAAVARLVNLGAQPLSPTEAEAALAGWQFAHGIPLTAAPASPAYFTLTGLLMSLGGDGDTAARLAPALFGVLTVALPWLWRGRFQPAVWLTAGVLLAFSPIQMILSRTAGGDAIALFALLLLAVTAARLDEGDGWGVAAGAALGLGLTTAPLFYTGLVAFLPAWWVFRGAESVGRGTLHAGALAAVIAFITVAAGGLFYPEGLGGALMLLPQWLGQFGLAGGAAAREPLLVLLRYELGLFLLGIPAAVGALSGDNNVGKQLVLWLGLLLPVILLQMALPHQAAAVLVPGYLLIGLLAGDLMRGELPRTEQRRAWLVGGGLALLGMTLLVSIARFTQLGLWTGSNASLISLAVLAFALAGVAVIVVLAWESPAARRGAFLAVVAMLLYWQWGTGWHLSQAAANDPGERWVTVGTDDDVPRLVGLLERISREVANSDVDLSVFSAVDSPVLRWYFRAFERFESGPALPIDSQADVVITAGDSEPQLPNDYFGADFGLEQHEVTGVGLTSEGGGAVVDQVLRAWLFHHSSVPVEQQRIVVWVRSDLATAK